MIAKRPENRGFFLNKMETNVYSLLIIGITMLSYNTDNAEYSQNLSTNQNVR